MNKKIIYIVCCLFALFMPISLVQAKTVEELIEEQNSFKLGADDRVNITCEYHIDSFFGMASRYKPDSININIKYNDDSKQNIISTNKENSDAREYVVNISPFLSGNLYYCPETIYAKVTEYTSKYAMGDLTKPIKTVKWDFISTKPSEDYAVFKLYPEEEEGSATQFSGTKKNGDSIGMYYPGLKKVNYVCGEIVSDKLLKEIVKIYKTICLVTVAVVIILGILDFMKAISSDDDSALKKAASTFIKRVTIVIILVILPILLQFILTIFGDENMKECLDKIK